MELYRCSCDMTVSLPCGSNVGPDPAIDCFTTGTVVRQRTWPGSVNSLYPVTLHVQMVAEQKKYSGGTSDGRYFQIGGTPALGNENIYRLTITGASTVQYYLNASSVFNLDFCATTPASNRLCVIDYTAQVNIRGNTRITLLADSVDSTQHRNLGNLIIGSFCSPLILQPYNGQFAKVTFTPTLPDP